jgi:hypothetical protein
MSRNFYKIICRPSKSKLGKLIGVMLSHETAVHSMKRISVFSCEIIIKIDKINADAFAEEAGVVLKKPRWDEIF